MAPKKSRSIGDALAILNSAAEEGSGELQKKISRQYSGLQDLFSNMGPKVKKSLKSAQSASVEAKDNVVKYSNRTAKRVNKYAHKNPWRVAGSATLLGLALGFLIKKRRFT